MIKYEPVPKSNYCSPCCGDASAPDDEKKMPCSYIPLPKGAAKGASLDQEVEITIRGKIIGFSRQQWDGTDELRLELVSAQVKNVDEGAEFAELADSD